MVKSIYHSREKDYRNPFRQMLYDTEKEMEKVIGKLVDNNLSCNRKKSLKGFANQVDEIAKKFI